MIRERRKQLTIRAGETEFGSALRNYRLYGLGIKSQWNLPAPEVAELDHPEVELVEGHSSLFARASQEAVIRSRTEDWCRYARLNDGADYLHWPQLFEFVVSANGRWIAGSPLAEASWESFQTYLLGQVISYSLIKLGVEPLHATVIVINGEAVALLGDTGYGKSSLAAAFLQAGHKLLTDDLLAIKKHGNVLLAYPGPQRIKLFPETAKVFLGQQAIGISMNPYTKKLVIPLRPNQSSNVPRSLRAIYVLRPPKAMSKSKTICMRKRSQRRSFLDLISNTFNIKVVHPQRLAQQFALATQLAASIPIKSLSYPRDLSRLPDVVETICTDLKRRF